MKRHLCMLACALLASPAYAGAYSDDLAKCLVSSTSQEDKAALVRWVFATAALHPDVASISSVSDSARDQMDRGIAALFQELLTERCRKQTMDAVRYEGGQAFQQSFGYLGQVAMQELMTDKQVGAGFSAFIKYVDKSKIEALTRPQ